MQLNKQTWVSLRDDDWHVVESHNWTKNTTMTVYNNFTYVQIYNTDTANYIRCLFCDNPAKIRNTPLPSETLQRQVSGYTEICKFLIALLLIQINYIP